MRLPIMIHAWMFVLAAGPAGANDSIAGLDGGNLVLKKSDNIRMESEELFLSMKEVRVHYVFRNTGSADVETIVAFPLPAMPASPGEDAPPLNYDPKSDNPLHFACKVDGRPVKVQTDRKKKGDDVEVTHYWTQRFPAGKTVTVDHSYKPALWQSYSLDPTPEITDKYCVDLGTRNAINKVAKADPHGMFYMSAVHYILKTARNWSGPIGDFKLTIDKGDPKDVLSLCINGIKKVAATRFEFREKDHVPDRDLAVPFVTTKQRVPRD